MCGTRIYVRYDRHLQVCVAVCCSVWQHVAVRCSVLQCAEQGLLCTMIATCKCVLQRVAACCSTLQCVAVCCSVLQCAKQGLICAMIATRKCVLQCVAACCSTLRVAVRGTMIVMRYDRRLQVCVAVCCSVLQCVAVCCSAQNKD